MRRWSATPVLLFLAACGGVGTEPARDEASVLEPVRAFYAAFDDGFTQPAEFASDDWNHIGPLGTRTHSKTETLEQVRAVHQTFLKGVTDTVEDTDVRFASDDVAVVTVTSQTSPQALPTDPEIRSRGQIRTFVVVRKEGAWRVMQDQNTEIAVLPDELAPGGTADNS